MKIAITGTPCTGKTEISKKLAERLGLKLISVNDLAKKLNAYLGEDRKRNAKILDMKKINDFMGLVEKNVIIEGHTAHEIACDVVIVLRRNPEVLEKRLKKRYPDDPEKVKENVDAEILGVVTSDAVEFNERIYEVDTSEKTVEENVDEIVGVINGDNKGYEVGKIDWLEKYEDKLLKTDPMIKNYKNITKNVYEKYAKEYEENTKDYHKYIQKELEIFLKNLKGKRVLDVGSGPGRDSFYFKKKGLEPLCIDLSEKMIGLCKEKGLNAEVMDIESMNFEGNSFDGIWAYTSLIHVPKKKMKNVLRKIYEILKPDGIFFIGMTEGSFEGMEEDEKYSGEKRFKVYYTEKELLKILSGYFTILNISKVKLKNSYINIICKSKKTHKKITSKW